MKEYKLKSYNIRKDINYKINYEAELNTAQLEAVKIKEGPVLVIAGAGTGKTKTLVYRAARLVEEGVRPENILLLTFTRKAALNMLKRASKILDERCGKISGGTFHSFANLILRKYAKFAGFNGNFTIIDENDAENAIGIIRARLGYNKTEKRFPLKHTVAELISKSVNKNIPVEFILNTEYPHFMDSLEGIKIIQMEYTKYKKEKMLMDYDDLLLYLKLLLKENEEIRKKISNFYKYIMIDEYQDTNKIQADLAYLIASEHNNIMVVGDDSQSIYSFRGANFKNIMDFPKQYPNCKIITLEQNYRSTQPILDFTNALIENAREKYSKKLFTKMEGDLKPVYIETDDTFMQSKFVVQRVLELREEGIPLNKIAVLFRNAWHSNDLEIELASANIKYAKYGGIKFTEAAHIKDIISYLKISYNPLDSISWFRILQLIEGIGEKTAEFITEEIVENNKGINFLKDLVFSGADINGVNINEYKKRYDDNRTLSQSDSLKINYHKKYYKDLYKLFIMLEKLSDRNLTPFELINIAYDYYKPIFENKYDDFNKRFKDIESLLLISQRYKKLSSFLSDMTIEPIEESQTHAEPEDKDDEILVLSTIHSAKGLEWHTVFVIYLVDGFLPSTMSLSSVEEIEEERRLLYVAATRAKQNLYLIKPNYSKKGGNYFQSSYCSLSEVTRFLKENNILEKYTEKWVLSNE
ncbi:MAG: ATP-dependent helicase [Actinobacteria bacterium]|nr:ATP-dependent helicase [Cyanobacteriota bacterium]MCL5771163.1 ATP-dependent helicase [Actinomycetota bacterium]